MINKFVVFLMSILIGLGLAFRLTQVYFYGCLGLIGLAFVFAWSPHRFQERDQNDNNTQPLPKEFFPWIVIGYLIAGILRMFWN